MIDSGWRKNKYGGLFNISNYMNNKIRGITDYNEDESEFLVDNQNLIYDPNSLTEEQRKVVSEYTNGMGYGDSKMVNGYLNDTRELSDSAKSLIEQKVKILDSCIDKEVKKSFYAYRGINIRPEELRIGKIIENKGYTSASLFKNDAAVFAQGRGTTIKLKVKSGVKALYIGRNTSSYRDERELLIERGRSIRITNIGDEVVGELI